MQIYNNKMIVQNAQSIAKNINNKGTEKISSSGGFQDLLNSKIEEKKSQQISFSKHASMRLNNRNITLSNEQIKRVEEGINKATQKGINDSLVLVDDVALVVNIKNRVVITAIDKQSNNENVFTNIDGAVIV